MRKAAYLIFILILVFVQKSHAQVDSTAAQTDTITHVYSTEPEFPGGMDALYLYISRNLRYPASAQAAAVQGKVYVAYVVNEDGSISDVKVVRGIGSGCDEEAVRIIQLMPRWKPGTQNGKPVKIKYTMPIVFKLH